MLTTAWISSAASTRSPCRHPVPGDPVLDANGLLVSSSGTGPPRPPRHPARGLADPCPLNRGSRGGIVALRASAAGASRRARAAVLRVLFVTIRNRMVNGRCWSGALRYLGLRLEG